MILIIESGASKTHWRLKDQRQSPSDYFTGGLNIAQDGPENLELPEDILNLRSKVKQCYAFLAGYTSTQAPMWSSFIHDIFPNLSIQEVYSDLMASCLSTAGDHPGIIGILGTGSNACYYDGKEIREKAEPLGFILGDEGGGFHLGKLLINDFFNKRMPLETERAFNARYNLRKEEVFEKVYKDHEAKSYVASFARFLENRQENYSQKLISGALHEYFEKYLLPLYEKHSLPLYFTGSIAKIFNSQLHACSVTFQMQIKMVIGDPMENLSQYFYKKNSN